ncbi:MAG TPA: hypothetical protein VFA75_21450 [Nevskia sp.]|nr:hypothetical protein [Nevskia sp.]
MQTDVSKSCSDFLRSHVASSIGVKLKASHAHELVAAYFGYKSRAALLDEKNYPLSHLDEVVVLVPDVRLIEQRRGCLDGLTPLLPSSLQIASLVGDFLKQQGHFSGKVWLYESLESYVMEELLREEDSLIQDELSGVMAETNAYFDEAYYESAEVTDEAELVRLEITGQYNGDSDPERPFCGDKIDMIVTVELYRVAGRVGFSEPNISVSGGVNDDWVDPELKFENGVQEA